MVQMKLSFDNINSDESLYVRDADGVYQVATAAQVLAGARKAADSLALPGQQFSSPQAVKDFLVAKLAGIEHEVRVTEDLTCPDTGAMREMDELLERWRTEGKPALVHCYMGVGRCRTVVSAHLAARIGDVRRAFLWTGRPETERQKEFVREYAEKRAQA